MFKQEFKPRKGFQVIPRAKKAGAALASLPARSGAVVGRLLRAPDSQDEYFAALVCKCQKMIWQSDVCQRKL